MDGVLSSTVTYDNNALNQMEGYVDDRAGTAADAVVDYFYDANGARTNKTVTTAAGTVNTGYTYDEDNRLISVAGGGDPGASAHAFKYDYRSRRYHRSTPGEETFHVFDGGLAVQENEGSNGSPQPSALETEFVRGEGMGGGVGGMVYSLKHDAGNLKLVASHSNHRGDVIARSDATGSLTSFALYEAYGTRPYEWGNDPDRQKANTKEEESDLGLLNEGMRYRDLDTGVFLTRDPIGYGDGPNVYCYVHCNPITKFDLLGLITAVLFDHYDNGGGWDPVTGRCGDPYAANRKDFEAAAPLMGEPMGISGLKDGVDQLRKLEEPIDKVVIMDHGSVREDRNGNMIAVYQDLGGSIKPQDKNDAELYSELGSLVEDGGYIEHLGCRTGEDPKTLQKYANLAGVTVVAHTGKTKYSEGEGAVTTGKMVYRQPQKLVRRKEKIANPRGERHSKISRYRLYRGDVDVTESVITGLDKEHKDYEKRLSREAKRYDVDQEEHFYKPPESD